MRLFLTSNLVVQNQKHTTKQRVFNTPRPTPQTDQGFFMTKTRNPLANDLYLNTQMAERDRYNELGETMAASTRERKPLLRMTGFVVPLKHPLAF